MRAKCTLVPPVVVSVILLTSGVSIGTTLLALNLEEMTRTSDEICTGRVVDKTSFLKDGRIYTLNDVEVIENIKGDHTKGTIVEVVTAGGHSELFSQKVFGAPEFEVNETYLLFLEKRGIPDVVHPVGMIQGALPISVDSTTHIAKVHPPSELPRLLTRDPVDGNFRPSVPWITKTRLLDDVVREIRTIAGGSQ